MTLAGQSQSLSAGTFLIARGTPLPPAWRLEDDSAASGWSRLANTFDSHRLEKGLIAAGWTFFFMAGAITTTAFGLSRPRRFDAALARLITAVRLQKLQLLGDRRGWDALISRNAVRSHFSTFTAHPEGHSLFWPVTQMGASVLGRSSCDQGWSAAGEAFVSSTRADHAELGNWTGGITWRIR